MTLRNDQLQASLISILKSLTNITDEVTSDEIRENEWQGTQFTYPNIRIRLISNTPLSGETCGFRIIEVGFQVHSESSSSLESDRIAGIINDEMQGKARTANNITFSLRLTNLMPAFRSDAQTWRSEVLMSGVASENITA